LRLLGRLRLLANGLRLIEEWKDGVIRVGDDIEAIQ
jgi:hypothetical protein